jgi:hypothetical protein
MTLNFIQFQHYEFEYDYLTLGSAFLAVNPVLVLLMLM